MTDIVDAVAQAIWKADDEAVLVHYRSWEDLHPSYRNDYRRMAQAAIDAVGLTEEWRCRGWVITRDEAAARKQHQANGGEVQTRLVSPWRGTVDGND